MIAGPIYFEPVGQFRFEPDEIELMIECSQMHYDHKCQMAGRESSEGLGLLVGLRNYHRNTADSFYKLRWRDLDLMAKILEVGQYAGEEKGKASFGLMLVLKRAMHALDQSTPEEVACGLD